VREKRSERQVREEGRRRRRRADAIAPVRIERKTKRERRLREERGRERKWI
jgi:hypothetical protein